MVTIFRYIFCFTIALCYSATSFACDHDDTDGLDVGLVLSGGGAKSSVQVGIMQVLDELGLPVHCVSGSSMGAVIGAFYASGYSPDEIENIFTNSNWGELFTGATPRRDKSFVQKEREENYLSGNIAGIDEKGVKLPGGLASMQGLKTFYRGLLSDIPLNFNFDDLEIPFRPVATDLRTGEAKAFKDGDLVEAILASMAVPGLFSPREIDGSIYVDGGISSILPIETARLMGADIIIAIDVSEAPITPTSDISVAATAQQITTIMVWRSLQRDLTHLKTGDLLINAHATNIGTASYDKAREGIAAGREFGVENKEALLAIKALAAPSHRKSLSYKKPTTSGNYTVENNTVINDNLIRNRFTLDIENPNNRSDQDRRLRNLASFGGFGEVDIGHSNGEAVLTVSENRLGRNLIQVGLNATSNFEGSSSYAVLARLTRRPMGARGGDISLSGEFGTNIGLSAEFYQPFGSDGRFFVQPELFLSWEQRKLDVADVRVGDFWVRSIGARARMGREIGTWGVVALETEIDQRQASDIVTIVDGFETRNSEHARLGVYLAADTLNRNDWPTSGQRLKFRANRAYDLDNTSISTDKYEASLLAAFGLGSYGLILNGRYGELENKGGTANALDIFQLGGFRQLGSLTDNSLPVDQFSYLSMEGFYRLTKTGQLIDLPIYVGAIAEYSNVSLSIFDIDDRADIISGTLYFGADTPIGPLFIGGAYGENDTTQFFFKFGRTF